MKTGFVIAAAAFAVTTLAAPNSAIRHARHERREEGSLLVKRQAVGPALVLPMRIGLTQSNLDLGHDLLMEISDPDSERYGNYYTEEEIHELFAPSAESVAAVRAWLEEAGIELHRVSQSYNKQWLQFDAEAGEVEELLKTKFHVYEHSRTGKTSIGCDEYHVKEDIQHHIDYITPGIKMLEFRGPRSNAIKRRQAKTGGPKGYKGGPIVTPAPPNMFLSESSLAYCDTYISPACIRAMYQIPLSNTSVAGNELGIYEESPFESIDNYDMNLYFTHLAPEIPNGTFPKIIEIDGAKEVNTAKEAGTEAILDFQISYPIIYPQNSVLFLTDSNQQGERAIGIFNTFLDAIDGSYCTYSAFGETGDNNTVDAHYPSKGYEHPLQCGAYKPTNVISFSYELAEFVEGTAPNYQMRQCSEYMKLGMRGHTFVFSSGDAGVESNWGCIGTRKVPVFNPGFPSNCPYVLSIGATTLTGAADEDAERATTQFPSGGGFSNYFARPSYQAAAVAAYFKTPQAPDYPYYTGPDKGNGYYNRSGRGFPDVSSVGQAVLNFGNGEPYLVGGTSASAPTWAAILTRINEERLKAGMKTVGFVNPTLYKNPQAFHDITVGNSKGCGTEGFPAAVGWDPVTGLGTPIYPELLKVFGVGGYSS